MSFMLENETVVVTGGAKRVGRAIALACAEAGANVAITYNSSKDEALATVADLHTAGRVGAQFASYQGNVSQFADVSRLKQEIQTDFGSITALVNNAAIFRRTPFETLVESDFDEHIAANLKGPYLLSKAFGDAFLEQGRGSIVNIADIHGVKPLKNYVPYCISKAGVIMLTKAMAKALAPSVRVNCICPGTILLPSEVQADDEYADDEEHLTARVPLKRIGTPEEIAATVVFLIGGPQFISGAILPVDGAESLR